MKQIQQKPYRTKKRMDLTSQKPITHYLAVQTLKRFEYALTILPNNAPQNEAHVIELTDEWLSQKQDVINLSTFDIFQQLDLSKLSKEKAALLEQDLLGARMLYSVIMGDIREELERMSDAELAHLHTTRYIYDITTVSARELLQAMGYESPNELSMQIAEKKMQALDRVYGCMTINNEQILHRLLVSLTYNITRGTITFIAPYARALAIEVMKASIVYDVDDKPVKYKGRYKHKPYETRFIYSEIYAEKNKRAVEIVIVIDSLIEKAGPNSTPNISVQTIIDRCPTLSYDMDHACNKTLSTIIKRAFKRAGELLITHTDLYNQYEDLQIPDLSKVSIKKLKEVLYFTHRGYKSRQLSFADIPASACTDAGIEKL